MVVISTPIFPRS